ncbi:alpha/beta hydrolase [Microlunatus ginsengisoli]|uniref:Alpha/beta hydrolase fold-5 domain-containing protein n=1 Tax=Microlunatus ginsengisoli TaxID=363863 RepID=A0ABP7AVV1_9ACTN
MSQPGSTSRTVLATIWLALGVAMVVIAGWVGWTRWEPLLNGHPALLVATVACAVLGFIAVVWAIASLAAGDKTDLRGNDPRHQRRTRKQLRRRAELRLALAIPALFVCIVLVAVVAWAKPFAPAPGVVAALRTEPGVRFTDTLTWYELAPTVRNADGQVVQPKVGLVFVPGARVDPRAYAPLLTPLARAGNLVIVVKDPFGIALTDRNHAARPMAVHTEIVSWVVGGHSLGGTAAADFADQDDRVKGLLLWASYPASPVTRTGLQAMSIYGTEDGLATPATIEAHKSYLPPDTQYVEVTGGLHAYFGDYGPQPGDGTTTVDRLTAQKQVVEASQKFLAGFAPPPPKQQKK